MFLTDGLVQDDSCPVSGGKFGLADISDCAWLRAANPYSVTNLKAIICCLLANSFTNCDLRVGFKKSFIEYGLPDPLRKLASLICVVCVVCELIINLGTRDDVSVKLQS
ncbi:hypothetical protein ALC60_00613 [Trachymyrmex zeteki]|uniref:Uncharacterized protein n=1 Tax=Mycetomoellerius zeteki TaxID=64791 RepID=A0A151XIH5_9HYME|nr:hypothetical protein ALC60_00613 [Trachymyrmex zeteki]